MFELYQWCHSPESVGEAMVSTIIAILEDRGLVDVTEPLETCVPVLEGTAWEGTSVLAVLDMASGATRSRRSSPRASSRKTPMPF